MKKGPKQWKLARRTLEVGERTLVMGVLNLTPDSFSDGGHFYDVERAVLHAEEMLADGADIIDVGGESTRPGSTVVSVEEELRRIIPVIGEIIKRNDAIISVDTTKAEVAQAAIGAGAEIVNDISGLRFDAGLANVAASVSAGLVLMHSRGTMETLHKLPPVEDALADVLGGLGRSVNEALRRGVQQESIAIDPGIGFGKSHEQNIELLAKLRIIIEQFPDLPVLVGTSRKRFIGWILGDAPVGERLFGTMATVTAAVLNGADIVRVHDVKAAVDTVRVAEKIRKVDSRQ
jgi:dihydropteroate synthase